MPVPAQVQAQADKADAMLKELSDKEKAPPVAAAVKPEDQGKDKPDEGQKPPEETVESLKQKLAVLQGKYNSEIVALQTDVNLLNNLKHQVRTLTGQLSEANGKLGEANVLIGDLQKQITEKQPAADDGKAVLSTLSEEDLEYLKGEGFDERIVGIIGKALSKREPAKTNQDRNELEQIKKEIQQEKAEKFWSSLTEKVPDWESINTSDPFNDWLDEKLPYSSKTLRDALQGAQAELNSATVIQMFNDFKSANPAKKEKKSEHQIDPAKQIEPASSVAHEQPADGKAKPAGKIYTRQEVKDFYKDFSLASAMNTVTEEMKKTDADILLANNEGRIQ